MSKELGILYIGPVRVEAEIKFIGGLLVLTKKDTNTVIGYPRPAKGACFVQYNIDHLHHHLQAALRTPKNLKRWTSLMFIMEEVWEGNIEYQWGINDVICHLKRIS